MNEWDIDCEQQRKKRPKQTGRIRHISVEEVAALAGIELVVEQPPTRRERLREWWCRLRRWPWVVQIIVLLFALEGATIITFVTWLVITAAVS
jgi:hypothetical protein